jgi:pimeloyl-ACP methyl ester carboxylesterase
MARSSGPTGEMPIEARGTILFPTNQRSGYRCIAHDRRGHGRSSQPWTGNDMDT